jgi:predicted RNA-binding protein with PUA domain
MSTIGANVVTIGVRTISALATHNDEFFSMFHDSITVGDEIIVQSVDGEVYGVRLLHKRHLWLVTAISNGGSY